MGPLPEPAKPTPATIEAAVRPRVARAVPATSGVLVANDELAKMYVWGDAAAGFVLLMIGRREVIAATVLRVRIDDEAATSAMQPGGDLMDGNPGDTVFAATAPIAAKAKLAIEIRPGDKFATLGVYHTQRRRLIARQVPGWAIVAGFPLSIAAADAAGKQTDLDALLDNFKALKSHWPELRIPAVAAEMHAGIPVPGLEHRQRVMGNIAAQDADGSKFVESGRDQLNMVLRMAEVYGAQLSPQSTTLDWGVGCGRLARHLPRLLHGGFVDIDVDPVNISWCSKHLPFGRYETVDPYGRTSCDDRAFDFIYSHSVFTHLSEPDQFHWLEELARISRGLMILSVRSLYGMYFEPRELIGERIWNRLRTGFVSNKVLHTIEDVTPKGYYRGSFHSPAYIHAKWSRFVDVIDIIPGGFGTRQDAVICRPRNKGAAPAGRKRPHPAR